MIITESTILNQYCYNNQKNDSFQVKDHYYHVAEDQAQTFQWSYSYKLAAYHDAMNQLQEYYDSITAYHNTEKFSYDQAVNQDHEMKSQESDYNIKKLKQTKIDENFFADHVNIIEIICWNYKLVFAFNNQFYQHLRLENCEKISKNDKKWQNSTAFIDSFVKFN